MKKTHTLRILLCVLTILLAFAGCSNGILEFDKKTDMGIKYKVSEDKNVIITGYTDKTTTTEITIPDEIDGMPVVEIADFGMFNSESLLKITIGKNVSKIGEWAFTNNQRLKEFNVLPSNKNFTSVDGILFTKDMKTLLFYPLAKNIKFNKFGEALNTTTYDIPSGVEKIRSKAFYKCYNVENISIPNTVSFIGEKAFHRCSSLKSVKLPNNLEFIGKDAFAYCELIESVTIPKNVNEIDEYAFFNCKNIKNVVMLCSKDDVKLGNKWFPTSNGKQVNGCNVIWK